MMHNPFDLTGKVAVVTGGGRGIGLEIARTLAAAGARLAVADVDAALGEAAAASLTEAGAHAIHVPTDVRDTAAVDAMAQRVIDHYGQIDILVNNAGVAKNVPSETCSDEDWLRIMDINTNGVFRACRAVGRHMLERRSGAIVNIASMSGSIVNKPQPQSAYNASKAAVIMLTKSLAAEWASRGVRVNSVSPGYIGTEMTRLGMTTDAWRTTWLEMTPMGRVGEPVEIARAVWYLASDAASFATGTDLIVDGGYTCW
jgi:NAD(P)-dependent dehydrogenase (short-subunit alcohol dehydrogenase family)